MDSGDPPDWCEEEPCPLTFQTEEYVEEGENEDSAPSFLPAEETKKARNALRKSMRESIFGLAERLDDLDGSMHLHTGDEDYFKAKLRSEREIISRLLSLLMRYGLKLPSDAAGLAEALALIAPLHSASAATRPRSSMFPMTPAARRPAGPNFSEGNAFGILDGGGMAEKFRRVQAELSVKTHVELRFADLSYIVQRSAGSNPNPTVGEKCYSFWRTLFCAVPRVVAAISGRSPPKASKVILDHISGIFRPGELTLVLGPPGSGKTALLKLLAGRVRADASHLVEGEVLYNRIPANSGAFVLPKVVQLVEERDQHVPTLTVEETLNFAFDSMEGGRHGWWIPEKERTDQQKEMLAWMDKNKAKVVLAMRALGLQAAKDTIVGNEALRGVSGGERRRVTTAEMVVGSQDVMLMDSVSTGLDSSTTYDIISTAREAARIFKKTVVVALLQPPPEVFELFDNVCLLAGGHIIYFGPRDYAALHFETLGYRCPSRMDAADFLVEVPTDKGAVFWEGGANCGLGIEAGGGLPPQSPAELAMAWKASEQFAALAAELSVKTCTVGGHEYNWPLNQTKRFASSWGYHFLLCFRRHAAVLQRDVGYIRQRLLTCLVMGVLIGSIFFDLAATDVNAIFGALFFTLMFLVVASMVAIPQAIQYRSVLYKQVDAAFYPASADTCAQLCVFGALQVVEILILAPFVYFMVGLSMADGGARFVAFTAVLVAINLNLGAYFRLLAAVLPDFARAQAFGGISNFFILLYCGYLVPQTDIPGAWIWVFWANPVSWAFRTLVLNQFLSSSYSTTGLGTIVLDQYGFLAANGYIWGGVAFVFAQFVLFTLANALVLMYVRHEAADGVPITPVTSSNDTGKRVASGEDKVPVHPSDTISSSAPMAIFKKAEATAPFTPVTLSFHNLWYSVAHPSGDGELDLLKGVSGFCEPGKMTALMGSSGAGKTTLLDVLAGRKTTGTVRGDILLNGHLKESNTFRRIAGYVEQNDIHSPAVTVREAVAFSAKLRLPHELWNTNTKKRFVDEVLSTLELDSIGDMVVGAEDTGGLSIEQRKRLTIAVEMAANTSLLFLDEPTSGLDACAAQVVVGAIRAVAATGRTVICTVHQPSTTLFEMFDSLLLLKRGGETVYFGELGEGSSDMVSYLSQVPGSPPIDPNKNPATWMLEAIGAGTSGRGSSQVYADFYRSSLLRETNSDRLEVLAAARGDTVPLRFKSKFATTLNAQRMALLRRALAQYWRTAMFNYTRLLIAVVAAFVYASNFVGQEITTGAQLVSRLGVLYMAAASMGMAAFQQGLPFFMSERAVFYREQSCNMYTFRAYVTGYTLAELPYMLAATMLFSSIFYFMSGFEADAIKFGYFYLFFTLYYTFMSFLGQFLTAALPSTKIAQAVGSLCISLFSLFAGFLISPGKFPTFWEWAFWLDPSHYTVEGLVMSQYHDVSTPVQGLGGPVPTNVFVEEFFGGKYSFEHVGSDAAAMVVFTIGIRVAFFLAIKYVRHEKR